MSKYRKGFNRTKINSNSLLIWFQYSSSWPSLGPTAVGKRRQELGGSDLSVVCVGGEWVAGVRCVCGVSVCVCVEAVVEDAGEKCTPANP